MHWCWLPHSKLRWLTTGSELAFGSGQVLGTSAGASTQMKTGLVTGQHCWPSAGSQHRNWKGIPVLGQVLGTRAGASTQMKTGLVRGQYWQPAPKHPTYTRTDYINYANLTWTYWCPHVDLHKIMRFNWIPVRAIYTKVSNFSVG